MLTEFRIQRKTRILTLFNDQLKEKHGSRKSTIRMILTNKVHFDELAIVARKEDILPETVHNARRIIQIISTKEKDQYIHYIVLRNDLEDVDEIALYTNEYQSGWIIDSGATQHMTHERNNLSEYVEFMRLCRVNLGDNRVILAYGEGTYHLCTDLNVFSQKIALKNVLYLPKLEELVVS